MPFCGVSIVSSVGLDRILSVLTIIVTLLVPFLVSTVLLFNIFVVHPIFSLKYNVLVVWSCRVSFPSWNVSTLL